MPGWALFAEGASTVKVLIEVPRSFAETLPTRTVGNQQKYTKTIKHKREDTNDIYIYSRFGITILIVIVDDSKCEFNINNYSERNDREARGLNKIELARFEGVGRKGEGRG